MKPNWSTTVAAAALLLAGPAWGQVPLAANPGSILFWKPDEQLARYKAIETIYRTSTVAHGAKVHPLPKAGWELKVTVEFQGRAWPLDEFLAARRVTGLLVLQDGKVVLERYGLGRTAADRWTSFSVAKSVTSTLIGAAIRDGFIKSADAPMTDYIPELRGSAYEGVTVRQLLSMSSGVAWNEDYADPKSDVALANVTPGEPGMPQLVSYMRKLPRAAAPGTRFNYATGETDLAGILLARATKKSLAQYLSEKVWAPYGMEQDAAWMLNAEGLERGGCCLSMTLRDYARFGQFILDGGKAGGREVAPANWLAAATTDQTAGKAGEGYGYFWWMLPDGGFQAAGIFGQGIMISPRQRVVIALNAAMLQAHGADDDAAVRALQKAILASAAP